MSDRDLDFDKALSIAISIETVAKLQPPTPQKEKIRYITMSLNKSKTRNVPDVLNCLMMRMTVGIFLRTKTCRKCQKQGHIKRACRKRAYRNKNLKISFKDKEKQVQVNWCTCKVLARECS